MTQPLEFGCGESGCPESGRGESGRAESGCAESGSAKLGRAEVQGSEIGRSRFGRPELGRRERRPDSIRRVRPAVAVGVLVAVAVALAGCGFGEDGPAEDPQAGPDVERPAPEARSPLGMDPDLTLPDSALPVPTPVLEVERAYWWGEGTRGAEISAGFLSPEARRSVLDPDGRIGRFEGREWRLADILVQVRYRGPRAGASWQVSGPAEVIARYLDELRPGPEGSPLEEIGILEMKVEPCCRTPDETDTLPQPPQLP